MLRADSVLLPQSQKEVRAMKFCSTCREEFADKFSFCPVDGTPLSTPVVEPEKKVIQQFDVLTTSVATPILAGAPVLAAWPAPQCMPRGEYHLTMIDDAGLVDATRLKEVSGSGRTSLS